LHLTRFEAEWLLSHLIHVCCSRLPLTTQEEEERQEHLTKNLKRLVGGRRTGRKTSLFYLIFGICVQDGGGNTRHTSSVSLTPTEGKARPHPRISKQQHAMLCALARGVYLAPKVKKPCRRLSRVPRPHSPPRPWTSRPSPSCPNLNGKTVGRSVQDVDWWYSNLCH
jgi:hypothetical protein